ncbi:hypothetical protein [Cylindrospermum sp. FACHB-282]|uniref:hypothetical protein n=1 Tax=Cylindrospermum sp. FACHB-282 TaxID=2692794 RepID=UPI001683B4B9|nr:hypothetical protein [Cylindrospermum sp. FACHB-282]MBD2385999.1 hypothetical protein [Cylindrospermum sp. FACHB-282]
MYTLDELEKLKTICTAQADDLKIQEATQRVWLSRCGVEDGEPFNNKVTIERYQNGHWVVVEEYEAH